MMAILLAGCGGRQSTLHPQSRPAHDIAALWWWMLVAAGLVFFGAVGLLALAAVRRRRTGLPVFGEREDVNQRLVVGFGFVVPLVVLVPLFVVGNLATVGATQAPNPRSTPLTIEVVGHQWWWEVRYPGTAAVTGNEIHIPAATRVNVVVTTGDVIHSLWVPALNRKIDLIPGRRNRVLLEADRPGVYRGQCAEYCGLQHAHMALDVIAEPAARFRAWLADNARPATAPAAPQARSGQAAFLSSGCASCHAIRGTPAAGRIGPDLTHLAGRQTLAGLTIPNTAPMLADWIGDPQHVKPGNRMPDVALRPAELDAVVSYLTGLR